MVKFEDRHITQPVARNEFELGRLHWSDHSEDEISKAVVENARRLSSHHEMTPRQTRALSRFKYDGSCKYIKQIASRELQHRTTCTKASEADMIFQSISANPGTMMT